MSEHHYLQKLTLKDSRELALRGFLSGSQAAVRREIRSWMNGSPAGVFLKYTDGQSVLCVIALFPSRPIGSSRMTLYWPSDARQPGPIAGLVRELLADLLNRLFFHHDLHRVEWLLPDTEHLLIETAVDAGFKQEGTLSEAVVERNIFRDGVLLGAVRSQNSRLNYGFVNFSNFLITVLGESNLIRSIDLLDREAPIESSFLRECAYRQGLADDKGAVSIPDDLPVGWVSEVELPQEVELCCAQISEYVRGQRRMFAGIRLDEAAGTTFQWSVWRALRDIPFGQVRSYQEVADTLVPQEGEEKEVGSRRARAVGAACGANPFMLLIPCHRVLGKDGKLTGFSGGIDNKAALLDFELMGVRPDA